MGIYAVIKTGGKQYRVTPGDIVKVEKLALEPGATLEISEVYLLVNDQGMTAGSPTIPGARVVAEVVEEGRDKKVVVFKKKRRKGYRKTIGHRQYFTTLRISEIILGDKKYKPASVAPKAVKTAPMQASQAKSGKKDPARLGSKQTIKTPHKPLPQKTTQVEPESNSEPNRITGTATHSRNHDAEVQPAVIDTQDMPAVKNQAPTQQSAATSGFATHRHRYWIAAILLLLVLIGAGLFFSGSDQSVPDESVPLAVEPQEQTPQVQVTKPKPVVRDVKIKKPAGVSAPSAPAQPPD